MSDVGSGLSVGVGVCVGVGEGEGVGVCVAVGKDVGVGVGVMVGMMILMTANWTTLLIRKRPILAQAAILRSRN